MVTKAQTLYFFLIVNVQLNHVLLLDTICTDTSSTLEDILPTIWTSLAWRNVHLKELNLETKADFHNNLMSISTRKNINLKISFLANNKVFSNGNSKLTLISRCDNDFYGFENFIRIQKPFTTMIFVSRTYLVENILSFVKEIKMPTSFFVFDNERQAVFNFFKQNFEPLNYY